MGASDPLHGAARQARKLWLSRRALERSVVSISHQTTRYQRILHGVRSRSLFVETEPGVGTRKAQVRPLPVPGGNPWDKTRTEWRAASECVADCPTCDGTKQVACGVCAGVGRAACAECRGGGRVRGQRGMK